MAYDRQGAYTKAPLQIQYWEHGADACDLGDDADVCVDASSSAVVAWATAAEGMV